MLYIIIIIIKLNGRWFPQIVDRDSGNLYPIYIVVLVSEPVGGRSRATSCLVWHEASLG